MAEKTKLTATDISELSDADLASFFVLDKLIMEDEFVAFLADDTVFRKLAKKGLRHLGDIIAISEEALIAEFEIPRAELGKLRKHIEKYHLRFGGDVQRWRLYRQQVDRNFRMPWSLSMAEAPILDDIYARIAAEMQKSHGLDLGPLASRRQKVHQT